MHHPRRPDGLPPELFPTALPAGPGEAEDAFEEPSRADAQRALWMGWLKVDADLDALRSDTRFTALLKKLNLRADPPFPDSSRAVLRRRRAELNRRIYEVDPLVCPGCPGVMMMISFIPRHA